MGSIAKLAAFILCAASCFGQMHKHWLIAPRPGPNLPIPSGNLIVWLKSETIQGNTGDSLTNWIDSSSAGNYATNRLYDGTMGPPVVLSNALVVTNLTTTNRFSAAAFYRTNWLEFNSNITNSIAGLNGITTFIISKTNGVDVGFNFYWILDFNSAPALGDLLYGLYQSLNAGSRYTLFRGKRMSVDPLYDMNSFIIGPDPSYNLIEVVENFSNGSLTMLTNTVAATNVPNAFTTGTSDFYAGTFNTLGSFRKNFNPTLSYLGWIAELIMYNSALSTSDRQAVEMYLTNKFGIPFQPN